MVFQKIFNYMFVKVLDLSRKFKILQKGVPDSVNKNDEKKFIKKLF